MTSRTRLEKLPSIKSGLCGGPPAGCRGRSGGEGGAAAAGLGRVGVVEDEAPRVEAVVVVDDGAHEVEAVAAVGEHRDPLLLELEVVLALAVEAEDVAHARAAAALDADAEAVVGGDLLVGDDPADLGRGAVGQLDRARLRLLRRGR